MNSYRGIRLSSVISKALEFLLLERLEPFFLEANIPHIEGFQFSRVFCSTTEAVGIHGKMWRIIKNWYMGAKCQVKLEGGALSKPYPVERGVKQGSVLSLALFLLIMDPLLSKLQRSGCGLSIIVEVSFMLMIFGH